MSSFSGYRMVTNTAFKALLRRRIFTFSAVYFDFGERIESVVSAAAEFGQCADEINRIDVGRNDFFVALRKFNSAAAKPDFPSKISLRSENCGIIHRG